MFDDAAGKLKNDPATWKLIADRDAGEFPYSSIEGRISVQPGRVIYAETFAIDAAFL